MCNIIQVIFKKLLLLYIFCTGMHHIYIYAFRLHLTVSCNRPHKVIRTGFCTNNVQVLLKCNQMHPTCAEIKWHNDSSEYEFLLCNNICPFILTYIICLVCIELQSGISIQHFGKPFHAYLILHTLYLAKYAKIR